MKVKRCTKSQLEEICTQAGLTDRQKYIVKRKLFDGDNPLIVKICDELHISKSTYHRDVLEIKKMLHQYIEEKGTFKK